MVISGVTPEIECGRFPIKRTTGESVAVEADVFADGHDAVACRVLYKKQGAREWEQVRMEPLPNDRWKAEFPVRELGRYVYTLEAWIDPFETWRRDLAKRVQAGQDISVDLLIAARLLEEAAARAEGPDRERLHAWIAALRDESDPRQKQQLAFDDDVAAAALRYPDRRLATRYEKELLVVVDPPRARFSSWYEFFPRSCAPEPGRHGTLRDAEARLEYAASMGFDVIYLAPIHPIGTAFRKGRNNLTTAEPGDLGSPWAIGSAEGGHKAIHPALGGMADFEHFVSRAAALGVDVALDIAFQ
ncbi:MAG: DUF3416 domain-containing protein, partial [Acidobacteria bacterium]|nr:DUF3416 domain-containing protein [Acidobacteriota bacterium]